jgi:hypothetical protein
LIGKGMPVSIARSLQNWRNWRKWVTPEAVRHFVDTLCFARFISFLWQQPDAVDLGFAMFYLGIKVLLPVVESESMRAGNSGAFFSTNPPDR